MKDVKGYEGLYAITTEGKVWSYPKQWSRKNGIPSSHKGKWLHPTVLKIGYEMVSLIKDGVPTKKYIHQLVAENFLPKIQVNHKNGVKTDNRAENLEWVTPSQNLLHARQVLNIGVPRGERSACAKLTDTKVREIRRLRKEDKLPYKEIGKMFGVDDSVVSRIVNRQYWTHVE